jgi:ADP-ribosylglycohydrolase
VDAGVRDRVRGCAVGPAVGDALGMPLEFGPRRSEERLVREMHSGRLPVGTFTDGTETALALAGGLWAHSPLDPEDLSSAVSVGFVRALGTLASIRERCCGAWTRGSQGN